VLRRLGWRRTWLLNPNRRTWRSNLREGPGPVVFHVGPNVLIVENTFRGNLRRPRIQAEGLAALNTGCRKLLSRSPDLCIAGLVRGHCPNVEPAVETVKQMDSTRVKAMFVRKQFRHGWIDKGIPSKRTATNKLLPGLCAALAAINAPRCTPAKPDSVLRELAEWGAPR